MNERVRLARATVTGPSIALYDDPSAGLDPVTSSRIFDLIRAMHTPTCASVVVSHDIDRMAAIVDRWVVLAQGRVAFDGDGPALTRALAGAPPDGLLARFFAGSDALAPGAPAFHPGPGEARP